MPVPVPVPALLVITDETSAAGRGRGVVETVARALASPCPGVGVLVRAKHASASEVLALCRALLPIAGRAHAALLVHHHTELVRELGLHGVHLSSTDSSTDDVARARAALPPGALLGASRHAGDDLEGLDYATLSPVFTPTSKPADARGTLGLEGLRRACTTGSVPLLALGGIDERNALATLDAGAHGVAVLGAVMGARDPLRALRSLDGVLRYSRKMDRST